jgi:hypothetical protein
MENLKQQVKELIISSLYKQDINFPLYMLQ